MNFHNLDFRHVEPPSESAAFVIPPFASCLALFLALAYLRSVLQGVLVHDSPLREPRELLELRNPPTNLTLAPRAAMAH